MNVKYRQPLLLCQLFLHQMIISEDFYSRQVFRTFFCLPDLPKDRIFNGSDIHFVFFLLRLINLAVHKSEWYLFWRVKHKYLEWLVNLNFLPKYTENSRQVSIPDWVLLHCTHSPALRHANVRDEVSRQKQGRLLPTHQAHCTCFQTVLWDG